MPITFGTGGADYSDESDPGPMPIPLTCTSRAAAARNPTPRRAIATCSWSGRETAGCSSSTTPSARATGFRVSSSAVWDLTTNHTRPAGWTSADAAGLPILPGLLKYDEVADGPPAPRAPLHHSASAPRLHRACEPLRAIRGRRPAALRHPGAAQGRLPTGRLPRRCPGDPDGDEALRVDSGRSGQRLVCDRYVGPRVGGRARSAAGAQSHGAATSRCWRQGR